MALRWLRGGEVAGEEAEAPLLADDDALEDSDIIPEPKGSASNFQTFLVILSIYVGLGMLSQPYALRMGGWLALIASLVTTSLFTVSALMLAHACDLLPRSSPQTFPVLGEILAGRQGRGFVSAIAGLELLGGVIIALAVMFEQLELLLPTEGLTSVTPLTIAVFITALVLLPVLCLPDVAHLAPLSGVGTAASTSVALAVLSLVVVDPHRTKIIEQPPAGHSLIHWPGILQSVGIFSVSMSGASALPALRSAMRHPRKFHVTLGAAFLTMFCVYCSVAAAGYFYWGNDCGPVVTVDLATSSPYAHGSSHGSVWRQWFAIDRVLALFVLITCMAKVPALVMVIQDLLSGIFLAPSLSSSDSWGRVLSLTDSDRHAARTRRKQLGGRLIVAGSCLGFAVLAKNDLGDVLSLVGGLCSMATSLILPAAFYARLSWQDQPMIGKFLLFLLLVSGVALLLLVGSLNLIQMWAKIG